MKNFTNYTNVKEPGSSNAMVGELCRTTVGELRCPEQRCTELVEVSKEIRVIRLNSPHP